MFEISMFNKVSESGMKLFNNDNYMINEGDLKSSDGIVRNCMTKHFQVI